MVMLSKNDIKTREVLDWKGVHLLHFAGSSCSQKTRIFLNLKGIEWTSHPINLVTNDAQKPWFLGINPRGLVPVLVHDGRVHIESNDILEYLEKSFPSPSLIPTDLSQQIHQGLKQEDELHLDIRAISMRFVFSQKLGHKKPQALKTYQIDSGTIQGKYDPHKQAEIQFWSNMAKHGITDEQILLAAQAFKSAYDRYENNLATSRYLLSDNITVLDIAWFIYTHRLKTAGYPFHTLHPRVNEWYLGLLARPEFQKEVKTAMPLRLITAVLHLQQRIIGQTLAHVGHLFA